MLVLLFMTGSLVLGAKTVLMNLLSLSAVYDIIPADANALSTAMIGAPTESTYDADSDVPANTVPHPDPNPLDCAGHGSQDQNHQDQAPGATLGLIA